LGVAVAAVVASVLLGGCSALPVFSFGDIGSSSETGQDSEATDAPGGSDGSAGGGGYAGGLAGSERIPKGAWPATVTYVHDGDTLYLLPEDFSNAGSAGSAGNSSGDELKVRLIGIDTPEVGENAECYGEEATELLRDFLPEGTHVWAIEDEDPFDPYGRSLLYVFTDDGYFVNLDMISLGAAEAVLFQPNDEYYGELREVEQDARDAGLGMWGACR
jgi:micrococcal nuclease